jgi:hypothetical protein
MVYQWYVPWVVHWRLVPFPSHNDQQSSCAAGGRKQAMMKVVGGFIFLNIHYLHLLLPPRFNCNTSLWLGLHHTIDNRVFWHCKYLGPVFEEDVSAYSGRWDVTQCHTHPNTPIRSSMPTVQYIQAYPQLCAQVLMAGYPNWYNIFPQVPTILSASQSQPTATPPVLDDAAVNLEPPARSSTPDFSDIAPLKGKLKAWALYYAILITASVNLWAAKHGEKGDAWEEVWKRMIQHHHVGSNVDANHIKTKVTAALDFHLVSTSMLYVVTCI